jgi:NDP-sugar pyrophosphorylase family protein
MISSHLASGDWYELSTLERYLSINLELGARMNCWSEWRPILGEGCEIEDGARVERSVLWKRVRVERGAELSECIVGDDVVIPSGARFHRAAIVNQARLGQASEAQPAAGVSSEVIGENLVVYFG